VPPLRERIEDIPLLVWRFVDEFARRSASAIDAISRDMIALQRTHGPATFASCATSSSAR
jgi:transcriptional regulator with GAF, ATPase, and Fis domain